MLIVAIINNCKRNKLIIYKAKMFVCIQTQNDGTQKKKEIQKSDKERISEFWWSQKCYTIAEEFIRQPTFRLIFHIKVFWLPVFWKWKWRTGKMKQTNKNEPKGEEQIRE